MTTNYGERPGIEVQHTPGPWVFDAENVGMSSDAGYGILANVDPEGSIMYSGAYEVTHVICSGRFADKHGHGTAEANARLIAQAPALLEMAERALAFVESMPGADNVNLAADLRAVIAQARGEVAK